jgi:serine/threonine protein kinase
MTELSRSELFWINVVGDKFEEAWQHGGRPQIEDYVGDETATRRAILLAHLLGIELERRSGLGETLVLAEYLARFPDDRGIVEAAFGESEEKVEPTDQNPSGESRSVTLPLIEGFNVLKLLGAGSFGEVWLAEDQNLGKRLVALKALKPRSRASSEQRERALAILRHEARLLASVKHRHVNQVICWHQSGDNHFLVLNYVSGGSLSDRLKRGGVLEWQEAARYIADVGEGLMAVHARGIIHRDIKPSNILWDPETDEALLTDFGVAARLVDPAGMGGTPAFMAPEAFQGNLKPALDVYGLAATLFMLVTGETPFEGPDITDFQRQIERGLPQCDPRCKGLPQPLEDLLRAGLAAQPDHRPDLREFIATLRGRLNQLMADCLTMTSILSPSFREPMPGTPVSPRLPSTESALAATTPPVELRLVVSVQSGPDLWAPVAATPAPRSRQTRDMKKVPPAPDQILLRTGDHVRIEVCASQPGYLTVFNVGPTGNLNLLHRDEPSLAGLAPTIPPDRPLQIHDIEMTAPAGRERLFAVWSRLPLPLPLDQMHGLVERAETAATNSRPYVATRDMKRVQQAVGKLAPTEWRAIAIELDHSSQ